MKTLEELRKEVSRASDFIKIYAKLLKEAEEARYTAYIAYEQALKAYNDAGDAADVASKKYDVVVDKFNKATIAYTEVLKKPLYIE